MTRSTSFPGQVGSKKIGAFSLILVCLTVSLFGPLWMKGAMFLTLGIALLAAVILVIRGIKEPEILGPLSTPVVLLMSIGFGGYGIDHLVSAFEVHSGSGFGLPKFLGVIVDIMTLSFFVGLAISWTPFGKREGWGKGED